MQILILCLLSACSLQPTVDGVIVDYGYSVSTPYVLGVVSEEEVYVNVIQQTTSWNQLYNGWVLGTEDLCHVEDLSPLKIYVDGKY